LNGLWGLGSADFRTGTPFAEGSVPAEGPREEKGKRMKNFKRVTLPGILFALVIWSAETRAQSTIFNIPTTDTVAKGKAYAEFDFMPQIPGTDNSRLYMFNPRIVIGAPHNIEFGFNVPVYHLRGSDFTSTNGYVQPNIKWKFYDNEDAGVAMAGGALWNIPVNNRGGQDAWGILYALVSKKIKRGDYGPRFHVGPYGIVDANDKPFEGGVSFVGTKGGAILGYEQPISSRISIVADWFSGKNNIGYFTPGVSITLPKSSLLNVGYSIGNDNWAHDNATRNRFLFVYYGITF
jgi:hypothetical protein